MSDKKLNEALAEYIGSHILPSAKADTEAKAGSFDGQFFGALAEQMQSEDSEEDSQASDKQ